MPHYIYTCSSCQEQQELFHSFEEEIESCPACGAASTMEKIPALRKPVVAKSKTGQVVKDFIKSAKEDLEIEKQNQKKRIT